jgi:hypothetical protein
MAFSGYKTHYRNHFTAFIEQHFGYKELGERNSLNVVLFGYNKITNTWLNFYGVSGSGFNEHNFNVLGIVDYAIANHADYHSERLNNHNDNYTFTSDNYTVEQWLKKTDLAIIFDSGTASDSPDRRIHRSSWKLYDEQLHSKSMRNQQLLDVHNILTEQSQSCFVWEIPQYEADWYFDILQGAMSFNKKLCVWTQDYIYRVGPGDIHPQQWDYKRVYRSSNADVSFRVMWHFNDYTTIENNYAKNIFILSDKWASGKTTLSKELYSKDTGSYEILATEPVLETLGINTIGQHSQHGGFVEKVNYYNNLCLKDKTSKTFIIPLQGAYNPNMTGSFIDQTYLPELNKQIHASGENSHIKNLLSRNYGVSQSLVWLVNNPNNYSQSLDISNMHSEFRFTGSLSKSDMATEIDTNF